MNNHGHEPITLPSWTVHCPHPTPPPETVALNLGDGSPTIVLCPACLGELRALVLQDSEPGAPLGRLYYCPLTAQNDVASLAVFADCRETAARTIRTIWEQTGGRDPIEPVLELIEAQGLGALIFIRPKQG